MKLRYIQDTKALTYKEETTMNACKNFSKKYPALLAILTFFFMMGLLKLMGLMPVVPLSFGIDEFVMAVIVFVVTFLFMGKEKVSFSLKGIGYAFGMLRGYYIFMVILTVFGIGITILAAVLSKTGNPYQLMPFINVSVAALFVGIVEEFTFRGLMFGGLLQKFGNSKKSIILAAVISGFSFGALHVLGSALGGEITSVGATATAILKIFQCAIFGIILCFIYYKTRNLFVVAALHSLDDFLLLVATGAGSTGAAEYVTGDSDKVGLAVGIYLLFILILVPSLVRCIKDIKAGEAIPFDEDFLPRDVAVAKKTKKK